MKGRKLAAQGLTLTRSRNRSDGNPPEPVLTDVSLDVAEREVFGIMVEELEGYTTTLAGIWENELAAVNRELERLGLDALDPWDESTVLTAPEG